MKPRMFITAKLVAAWPEEKDGAEGYAIKYSDGYRSWCPKAEFERTARELSPAEVANVVVEVDEVAAYVFANVALKHTMVPEPLQGRPVSVEDRQLATTYVTGGDEERGG